MHYAPQRVPRTVHPAGTEPEPPKRKKQMLVPILTAAISAATSKSVIGKIVAAVVIHKLTKRK